MKITFKIFLSLLTVLFVLSSCKKYDEGPAISLLTKKMRVTGDWKAEKIISESGDVDYVDGVEIVKIMKDNTFERREGNSITESGSWEFSNDKSYLRFTYEDDLGINNIEEFEIIRLRNKELWVKDVNGDQINYIPA